MPVQSCLPKQLYCQACGAAALAKLLSGLEKKTIMPTFAQQLPRAAQSSSHSPQHALHPHQHRDRGKHNPTPKVRNQSSPSSLRDIYSFPILVSTALAAIMAGYQDD